MDRENSLIYSNYNQVYVSPANTILKVFKDREHYEHEKVVYQFFDLRCFGEAPKLISINDKQKQLELERISISPNNYPMDIMFYVSLLDRFDSLTINSFRKFMNGKSNIRRQLALDSVKGIDTKLYHRGLKLKPVQTPQVLVHGDYRTPNISISPVKFIDFEGTCLGDRNIDYAYIFLDLYSKDGIFDSRLDSLEEAPYFEEQNFIYYLAFALDRIMKNPLNRDKKSPIKLLERILK